MLKKVNIKHVADAVKLNWLIQNILVKIVLQKMDFIVYVNVAEIKRNLDLVKKL
jgi:hypothetical protein